MTTSLKCFAAALCFFPTSHAGAATFGEELRQAAEYGLENALQPGAAEAPAPSLPPVPMQTGFSGTADCYVKADKLTQYPPLLCAGAATATSTDPWTMPSSSPACRRP